MSAIKILYQKASWALTWWFFRLLPFPYWIRHLVISHTILHHWSTPAQTSKGPRTALERCFFEDCNRMGVIISSNASPISLSTFYDYYSLLWVCFQVEMKVLFLPLPTFVIGDQGELETDKYSKALISQARTWLVYPNYFVTTWQKKKTLGPKSKRKWV